MEKLIRGGVDEEDVGVTLQYCLSARKDNRFFIGALNAGIQRCSDLAEEAEKTHIYYTDLTERLTQKQEECLASLTNCLAGNRCFLLSIANLTATELSPFFLVFLRIQDIWISYFEDDTVSSPSAHGSKSGSLAPFFSLSWTIY